MKKINLNGQWTLLDEAGLIHNGTVPGCVHTDLFDVDFLMKDKNSEKCRYIEDKNWTYKRNFHVDEIDEKVELVFEGLDTYCDIYLNGKLIGKAENMFIEYRFDVKGYLNIGDNEIEVRFRSPIKEVEGMPEGIAAFSKERINTRRIQCTYGWDWVDRFVTCGIFKDVYIEQYSGLSLSDVYVYTENIDKYSAQVRVVENFENYSDGTIVETEVYDGNGEKIIAKKSFCQEDILVYTFDIENPDLWYPAGYGEQPLYTLKIKIGDSCTETKFGIRTVKILQKTDEPGTEYYELCKKLQETDSGKKCDFNREFSGFLLIVNEIPIFCVGANWVPCEPFPSYESKEKITECLELSKAGGVNMVRVWGGGIFEQKHFYNECDRLGLMVTQDFLMACGEYPAHEEWFKEEIKKEVEFAAKYLRNHPSLIWWSGDNENAVEGNDEKPKFAGRIAARELIAPIIQKFDHNRRFLYSSPYGGDRYSSKTVGTTHNTNFIGGMFAYMINDGTADDYKEVFKEFTARFIAEEPVMGAVSRASLEKFISKEHFDDYDMWIYHTKTNRSLKLHIMDYMISFAERLFGNFADWDDKYFKMRYLQYEWVRITMENAKRNLGFTNGMIYWMLNDCWAANMGWSLIDYYNVPKAGYYAFKECTKQIGISVDKQDDKYIAYISNVADRKDCKLNLYVFGGGDIKNSKQRIVDIESEYGITKLPLDLVLGDNEFLVAEVEWDSGKTRTFYKNGTPKLKTTEGIALTEKDGKVIVKTDRYIHTVELEGADYFSDNFFPVLPGEEKIVEYKKKNKDITAITYTLNI